MAAECGEGLQLRIAVGIVTTGRAAILAETLAELGRQTRPPDRLVVCGAEAADVAGVDPAVAMLAPRGLTRQRNAVLAAVAECDLLVFFDDDFLPAPGWLAAMEAVFGADPAVVAATGHVVADGASGPGLSAAEGRRLLRGDPGAAPGEAPRPVHNAYGCNMALRLAPLRAHGLTFDEALPLYGWLEDVDLCRRLARHGAIVRVPQAGGVHLGTKLGRTSGVRLGYSQVANPLYLARKRSLAWHRASRQMARNLAANLLHAPRPEPWIDRRGRLRGNLLALADLLRGRCDPRRILGL